MYDQRGSQTQHPDFALAGVGLLHRLLLGLLPPSRVLQKLSPAPVLRKRTFEEKAQRHQVQENVAEE